MTVFRTAQTIVHTSRELQRRYWPLILLGIVVLPLAFYNLEYYPRPWFDEGIHLQVPKNLVLYGKYATLNDGRFTLFDTAVSTGPPALLPIAGVFRLVGVGLLPARVVMALFLLATIIAFFSLARTLYGARVAIVATFLLISSPSIQLFYWGRQVMGEGPALFFFLMGVLFWVQFWRRSNWGLSMGAGLSFGLAMLTKNQYALIVPGALVLQALLNHRKLRWKGFIPFAITTGISVACLAFWYGLQLWSVGAGSFWRGFAEMSASAGRSIFVGSPYKMIANLRYLFSPDVFAMWGTPGLAWVMWLWHTKRENEPGQTFLILFTILWLIWFVCGSVGWSRYAFPACVLLALFVARFFGELTGGCNLSLRDLWFEWRERREGTALRNDCLWLLLLAVVMYPFSAEARTILTYKDDSPQRFAHYLDAHVPSDALIESWEWELDFLTDHRYHHPSPAVLDAMVNYVYLGGAYPDGIYEPLSNEPDYLIVGPFARWTSLYSPQFIARNCTLITSIGEYALYKISTP